MTTLTITGNQGWTRTDITGGANPTVDVVDATAASWNTRNTGSPQQEYPVRIRNLPNQVEVRGGTINGLFDPSMDWGNLYGQGNSASVFLQDCPDGSSLKGWTVNGVVFDAFRVVGIDNWLVEGCMIVPAAGQEALPYGTRDDCLEADQGYNGTVRNCLFEGAFTGLSFGDANTPTSALSNTILVDNVLLRMGLWFDDIPNTHASPIKAAANTPQLRFRNSVFAISRVDHGNFPRLALALSKIIECTDSHWLNLTDNPLPVDYPDVEAAGFILLEGATARTFWDNARNEFLNPGEPPPGPATETGIVHVSEIRSSGAIRIGTDATWSAEVTVGATNSAGTGTETVTLTVA